MSRRQRANRPMAEMVIGLLITVALVAALPASGPATEATALSWTIGSGPMGAVRSGGDAAKSLLAMPLRFEANRGQTAEDVAFLVRGAGHHSMLTTTGAVFAAGPGISVGRDGVGGTAASTGSPLRLTLRDADPDPVIIPDRQMAGVTNYLRGDDQFGWVTGVPSYGRVTYQSVYPGIDWMFRASEAGRLEYDFVVAAGADPGAIGLEVEGARKVSIDANGNLRLITESGVAFMHAAPVSYQDHHGKRQPVRSRFVLGDDDTVGFELGSYDRSRPLVIDPEVTSATYLAGDCPFGACDVAVGSDAAVYVAGTTSSSDLPTTAETFQPGHAGSDDVFVAKLQPGGEDFAFLTYLGAAGSDAAGGVAVDESGSAVVAGVTSSVDFPTTAEAVQRSSGGAGDAFVAMLTPDGSGLAFSTYLGGSGDDTASAVDLDASGRVAVAGRTNSPDFPTTVQALQTDYAGGGSDAFVAMLTSDRSELVFSTYAGGTSSDEARAVAAAPTGTIYVAGQTRSADDPATTDVDEGLPTTPGALQGAHGGGTLDGFVLQVGLHGSLEKGTYLGGAAGDGLNSLDVGPDGSVVVGGWTSSMDDPVTSGSDEGIPTTAGVVQPSSAGEEDGFIVRLNPTLSVVELGTYLGGGRRDNVLDVAVDTAGRLHATGFTESSDDPETGDNEGFPTTVDAILPSRVGGSDAFVVTLAPHGDRLVHSTHLGGSNGDEGHGIAVDPAGNSFVVGATDSPDFAWLRPLHEAPAGAFVASVSATAPLSPLVTSVTPRNGPVSGGTQVLLHGRRLSRTTTVTFGGVPALDVDVDGDDRITATVPPHPAGRAFVRVTAPAGTSPRTRLASLVYGQGAWAPTGSLQMARFGHTATLLEDGKVLVVGGCSELDGACNTPTDVVEIYDPAAGTWSTTGRLSQARHGHTATLLRDGRVLVAGGCPTAGSTGPCRSIASTELFDPALGIWTPTAPMSVPRVDHTATLIAGDVTQCGANCGKVLVAGGAFSGIELATTELFDPDVPDPAREGQAGVWTATGTMAARRAFHTATALPNGQGEACGLHCGKVVVVGGPDLASVPVQGAPVAPRPPVELYDPRTGGWTAAPDGPEISREVHRATLLHTGEVLVTGGVAFDAEPVRSSELLNVASMAWRAARPMTTPRQGHAAAVLPDGAVLVAGGISSFLGTGLASAEIFDPFEEAWTAASSMSATRGGTGDFGYNNNNGTHAPTATTLPTGPVEVCGTHCGKVLVVGGAGDGSAELYSPQPTVSGIGAPDLGTLAGPVAGGTTLRLSGSGFTSAARVAFGDRATVACPSAACRVLSYGALEVDTPAVGQGGTVEVAVVTGGGTATAPDPFTFLGPPGAVVGLAATALDDGRVRLSWTVPGSNGTDPPPARRFVVEQATRSDLGNAVRLCGGVCRFPDAELGGTAALTVDDLAGGVTYYWRVRALDDDGEEGPVSRVVSAASEGGAHGSATPAVPSSGGTAPGRVADLTARALSATSVQLSFSAVGSDGTGGPPAETYIVKESLGPLDGPASFAQAPALCGGTCTLTPARVGDRLTLTVTGVAAATELHYAVRAVDDEDLRGPVSEPAGVVTPGVARLGGDDRIGTAVAASRHARPVDGSAATVVLARADDPDGFADALAGTPLAAARGGPLLLTFPDGLHPDTADELQRVLPAGGTVLLLGGTAALAPEVADQVRSLGYDVRRVAGADRYATAVAVAEELGAPPTVLVATGDRFPDALAAGTAAAAVGGAVLLTPSEGRHPATDAYLDHHPDAELYAVGGPAARPYPEATGLVGADRHATAVAVAERFFTAPTAVGLARSDAFPDALAGGVHVANVHGPILLTPPDGLHPEVAAYLCETPSLHRGFVYGGTAALTDGVATGLVEHVDAPRCPDVD